jgi:hypothetical protein
MDDAVMDRKPGDVARSRPPRRAPVLRGRRRTPGEGFRAAHVMGVIALSSLVAAIFMAVVIAIARGETTPLYVTWMSALIMAAVSGLIAATIVISDRIRASRPIVLETPDPEDLEE